MILSLNEIKRRAFEFSHNWKNETSESAEAQTFWNEFFEIFGVSRRRVASFEKPSIKYDGEKGRIDLFWKGELVVEHKSAGSDLEKAYDQALDYFAGLRDEELPRYVIVSDFQRFKFYDLDKGKVKEFKLENLADNIELFNFMSGHETVILEDLDPVNVKAAELMGKLHDSLKGNGYVDHDLEVLLVRMVFCLFADDTQIFEKNKFANFISNRTNEDGTNLGPLLLNLFEVLNTPDAKRQNNLDEDLRRFPYIDGDLFAERIATPNFNYETRQILLHCCSFDWSLVSPAIFGSMFQAVMNPAERHDFGAHYTSEKNILKVVNSLFMDDLREEFEANKNNRRYLEEMLVKIGQIKILDPACGCGNFLIISYRELRTLQILIHKRIRELQGTSNQQLINIEFDRDLNVDSMHGIELFEFPARVAQVGLWLTDHLLNMKLSKELGGYYTRLPLKKTAKIIGRANALRLDWNSVVDKQNLTYIIGNPPFISKQDRSLEQQEDMKIVCQDIKNHGLLDYVSCWYVKATEFIQGTDIKVAFVSTNAITHGEQVGVLGNYLKSKGVKINFAHRTFEWSNEARGKAQVHVVIIGLATTDSRNKYLYEYANPSSEPQKKKVRKINLYLIDYDDVYIVNRSNPICNVPEIIFGSMPNDDGNLILSEEEKDSLIASDSRTKPYIRPLIGAREYLYGVKKYCIWLRDAQLHEIKNIPSIMERIVKVENYRKESKREATRKLASTPYLFGEIRQPNSDYILVPLTTSENRRYIPIAFLSKENIANNTCGLIPNAGLFHFGVLMSTMHMTWVNYVCGRLEGRYRYSNKLVYNNFPWPQNPDGDRVKSVEKLAKEVLLVRKNLGLSLADLYNPRLMPKSLLDAHRKLDAAVDKCYSNKKFNSDPERISFLFDLYHHYTSDSTE